MKCATPETESINVTEKLWEKTDAKTRWEGILKIYLEGQNICVTMQTFFFPGENIQHAIVPCQMTHTTMKVYNQQENVSFNMFNNNEAIEPKWRGNTVDDNACRHYYNECRIVMCFCLHVEWRLTLQWCMLVQSKVRMGKCGQDYNPLGGGGVVKKMSIINVCILFNF